MLTDQDIRAGIAYLDPDRAEATDWTFGAPREERQAEELPVPAWIVVVISVSVVIWFVGLGTVLGWILEALHA